MTRKTFKNFPYIYYEDWTSQHGNIWIQYLSHLIGRPNLRYLEIGALNGRSSIWMLNHILTHATCRATTIDIFQTYSQMDFHLEPSRFTKDSESEDFKGKSRAILPKLPPHSYDLIYVDGSHKEEDVLSDARCCWTLLKSQGILIFDDYAWEKETLDLKHRPERAIDFFLAEHRSELEILHKQYQVICKRI